jgi:hypothetical protein
MKESILREYVRQLLIEEDARKFSDLVSQVKEFVFEEDIVDYVSEVWEQKSDQIIEALYRSSVGRNASEFSEGAIEGRADQESGAEFKPDTPARHEVFFQEDPDYIMGYKWGYYAQVPWDGDKVPTEVMDDFVAAEIEEIKRNAGSELTKEVLYGIYDNVSPNRILRKVYYAVKDAYDAGGIKEAITKGVPIALTVAVTETLDQAVLPWLSLSFGLPPVTNVVGLGEIIYPIVMPMFGSKDEEDFVANYQANTGDEMLSDGRLLRKYIRAQLIMEDAIGFGHDLAASDKFGDQFFGGAVGKEGGREIKRAFANNADHQFLSTLDTVHWTGDFYAMEGLKGKGKDELSATMTAPGEDFDYPLDYGLWIKGRITLATNEQDNLYSGFYGDYGPGAEGTEEEVAHRDKSSGRNKRPTISKNYKNYGKLERGNEYMEKMANNIPYILDQATWDPSKTKSNNEALVDNWKPIGIILTREDEIYAISGLDYVEGTKEDVEEFALGVIKKIMLTAIELGVPVYDTGREELWSPI